MLPEIEEQRALEADREMADRTGISASHVTKLRHKKELETRPTKPKDNRSRSDKKKTRKQADIQLNDRGLNELSDSALRALVEHNTPPVIFSRAGSLVRLHKNEYLLIEPLSIDALKKSLACAAKFCTVSKRKSTKALPPSEIARNILALDDWPSLPEIKCIIETPVLRPDGSILSAAGYDKSTDLYLNPIVNLSELSIPETLTQDQAKEAARYVLDEIFSDFPFENNASRTNTLACLLSVIVRPMVKGNIPLTLLDKPQAGTGASLIADIISIITTGKPASMWGMPESEDEWRKSITGALIGGSPIVVIDNVVGKLKSSSLARVLTAKTWQDRQLGQNKMLNLPQEAIWIATGNNIVIGGDIARRAMWIRLIALCARPWTRDGFKHPNILTWVKESHTAIISALLTMARAWVLAGKPPGSAKLGSFEEWAQIISGILEFSGVGDFMGNATQLYDEMDLDVQQWDNFLGEWAMIHADHPINAGTLRDELISHESIYRTFQDSMPDDIATAVGKDRRASLSIGVVLRKHLDQIYPSGRKLTQEKDTHTKAGLWKVAGSLGKDDSSPSDSFAGSAGSHSHPSTLEKNISSNMGRRGTLPALPADKPNDGDCEKTDYPQNSDGRGRSGPVHGQAPPIVVEKERFKFNVQTRSKNTCCLCGRSFPYDLTPYFANGVSGYICVSCHMGGAPPEQPKAEAQTRLEWTPGGSEPNSITEGS
jgi:hypothetical protein